MQKLIRIRYFILVFIVPLFFACNSHITQRNDKKGYYEIRRPDGILDYIKYYDSLGRLNGGSINFNSKGNIRSFTYIIKDTIINGPSFRLYDDGKINYYDSYLNGVKEGISVHYNPSGVLTKKLYYRNGKRHGEQYFFDYSNGDTSRIEIYNKGILIDNIIYEHDIPRWRPNE